MTICPHCERHTPDSSALCERCGSDRTWSLTTLGRTYSVRWCAWAALACASVAVALNAAWMFHWALSADADLTDRLNTMSNLANWLTLVLVATWLWRSVRNADAFPGSTGRLGAGWALTGWFVPIVNLWMPIRVMAQTGAQELTAWWLLPAAVFWWLGLIFHRLMFADTQFLAYYGMRPTVIEAVLSTGSLAAAGVLLGLLLLAISKAQKGRLDRALARRSRPVASR